MNRLLIIIGLILICWGNPLNAQDKAALTIVKTVADKVMSETIFDFKPEPQKTLLGLQVIDLKWLSSNANDVFYAFNTIESSKDETVTFGINNSGRTNIWVNKKLVYQQDQSKALAPKEIAYARFVFDNEFWPR